MKISVGRGQPQKNKVLSPSNAGMSGVAQKRLDNVISAANRRHAEALKVDGIDVFIWNKSLTGLKCTCHYPSDTFENESLNNSETNIDGNLDPENFKIALPGNQGKASSPFRPPDKWSPIIESQRLRNIDPIEAESDVDFLNPESLFGENDIDSEIDHLLGINSDNYDMGLDGGYQTPCSICYRTGYVNGYTPVAGQRYVLDASGTYDYVLTGWWIDPNHRPFKLKTNSRPENTLQWTVVLPKYFHSVSIYVRNNIALADPGLIVEFRESKSNNEWQEATNKNLSSLNGGNNFLDIRIRPTVYELEKEIELTHIELIYNFRVNPIKAQIPQITLEQNYQLIKPTIQTNIELGAEIGDITRESVILESKYQEAWRVVSVDRKETSSNQVYALDLAVRIIHDYEILFLLHYHQNSKRYKNYVGLQRVQGEIP